MNNLKELTHEQHKNAERSLFVKKLLKKEITPYQYYVYLSNQFLMYTVLESYANDAGILKGIEDIQRANMIAKNLQEFEKKYGFETTVHLKSTHECMRYIYSIKEDRKKLLETIYLHHSNDVFDNNETYDLHKIKEKLQIELNYESIETYNNIMKKFMQELDSLFF